MRLFRNLIHIFAPENRTHIDMHLQKKHMAFAFFTVIAIYIVGIVYEWNCFVKETDSLVKAALEESVEGKSTVCPDSLLRVFKEELESRNIHASSAGIICWDGKRAYYSQNDSTSAAQAMYCAETGLNASGKRLGIKAWVDYDMETILNYWGIDRLAAIAILCLVLFGGGGVCFWRNRKTSRRKAPKDLREIIRIDRDLNKVTICTQAHRLPSMELDVLDFFLENQHRLLSKQDVKEHLWGNVSVPDNGFYVYISHVNKCLDPYGYRIMNIEKKGYRIAGYPGS